MKPYNEWRFFFISPINHNNKISQPDMKGGEKRMKYLRILLPLVAVALFIGGPVLNSQAAEDVRNSKHNLSATRTVDTNVMFAETTEVCVFCHTPHGGRTDVGGGAAPLWNRTLTNSTGYNMYTSPNFDNLNGQNQPKGVSLACLSCHDGTVAFDSLINLPGSGGNQGTGGARANWTPSGNFVDATTGTFSAEAAPFPNLGETVGPGVVDLSNDHPISMEIPTPDIDPQFSDIRAYVDGQSARLSAGRVAYISRFGDTGLPADPRDRLRAYPTVSGKPYIECASCHNPHENTSTRFLRMPSWDPNDQYYIDVNAKAVNERTGNTGIDADRNAGSLICLSCHQK